MNWRHVALDSVVPGLWRNGGGATRELATWPDGQAWVWRISVAEVEKDGPFSIFAGVSRWFAVLEGAGVELDIDGRRHRLTPASAPLAFDGAAHTGCRLLDGATRDFNLMLRAAAASAHVQWVAGACEFEVAAGATVAVFASQGATIADSSTQASVAAQTLAWRTISTQTRLRLTGARALWMDIRT